MDRAEDVRCRIERGIAERVFPGCVYAQVSRGSIDTIALGGCTYEPDAMRVTEDTVYDIASVTKVMAPMALAMQLVGEGVLSLDAFVSDYLPKFLDTPFQREARVKHLLTYTLDYALDGGAKAFMVGKSPQELYDALLALDLDRSPGTSYRYSNITAFLVTALIERVTGEKLAELFEKRIAHPMGMTSATFTPEHPHEIPPTEVTSERGLVQGVVHDESSAYLFGAGLSSGAAGLFANAGDVAKFLQVALNRGVTESGVHIWSEDVARLWMTNLFPELLPIRTPLGWSDDNNALFSDVQIHKGGFTGCMVCGDMEKGIGFVLLSNRTYPERPPHSDAFKAVWQDVMKVVFA